MSLLGEIESVLKSSPPITAATIYERIKHTDYLRKDAANIGRNKVAKSLCALKSMSRAFHAGKDEVSAAQLWSFEPVADEAPASPSAETAAETTSSMAELAHPAAAEPESPHLAPDQEAAAASLDRVRQGLESLRTIIVTELAEKVDAELRKVIDTTWALTARATVQPKIADQGAILSALDIAHDMMSAVDRDRADRKRRARDIIAKM